MKNFGLYMILTHPRVSYQKIAELCVKHRVAMLQFREKYMDDRQKISLLNDLHDITKNSSTKLICNDRADLAYVTHCDGLHLGQKDMPISWAQKIFPHTSTRYGCSTHSLEQAQRAMEKSVDYIGFGPVFATPTKAIPDPVVGLMQLKKVIDFANVPVVAIGGIDDTNIHQVLSAGARNIAMVRYFMETTKVEERILKMQALIEEYSN